MFGTSAEDRYVKTIEQNKDALMAQANELFQGVAQSLLEVRSRGMGGNIEVVTLGRREENPPSPEKDPLQHAVRVVAADFLVSWCNQNGFTAQKRTVPTADDTSPFRLREVIVNVSWEGVSE